MSSETASSTDFSPSASAYMVPSTYNSSYQSASEDEVASLPSESTTESDFLSDDEYSDAEEQWRESLQQLELLLTMVLVPFVGKYFGRRCAYWGKSHGKPIMRILELSS
jgi:hypothetical protein